MSIKYPLQLLKFEQELHVVTKQSLLTITKQAKQQKKNKKLKVKVTINNL